MSPVKKSGITGILELVSAKQTHLHTKMFKILSVGLTMETYRQREHGRIYSSCLGTDGNPANNNATLSFIWKDEPLTG